MSKKNMTGRGVSKYGKKTSHTGDLPLVPSLFDPNVMVPDEAVYKPKKKEVTKDSAKGLENFMELDD